MKYNKITIFSFIPLSNHKYLYQVVMHYHLIQVILISILVVGGLSVCTSSQYDSNGVCYNCDVTCKTCTSGSTTSCLTCDTTRLLTSFNSCYCKDGYVEKTTVAAACQALACHYSCTLCNNTVTACTSCSSSNFRVFVSASSTCPCIETYFDNNVAVCVTCHYSCTTCSASTISSCLTCNSATAHRSLSSNQCPCLAKYYDIPNTYNCASCNHECVTCVGTAANCTVCGTNRGAIPGCVCNQGYYDDGVNVNCIACHYSCQDCLNGTSCNKCDATKQRQLSSLSPLCQCKSRYFDNNVLQCTACNALCFRCSSTTATTCLTCNDIAFRQYASSTGTCNCFTGYYQTSPTTQLCSKCDSRCLTCSTATTNCTTCDPSTNRILTSNTCPCKAGFYQNAFVLCSACHSSCYTCTDPNSCTACVSSTLMVINSSTLCSCTTDKFHNTTSNVCEGCDYSCATCQPTLPTLCNTCPASSFRTLASSSCPCNMYYYNVVNNPICQRCHYTCQTCSAGTVSTCLTCNSGGQRYISGTSCLCNALFYDNGSLQQCQPCMYNCLTCTDATSCSSCNSTLFRTLYTNVTPSTCGCNIFYFQENQTCHNCLYSCLTCNVFATCLNCDILDFRVYNGSTLLCDCIPGYYDNFVDSRCLICLPQCLVCTNATTCTTCSAIRHRQLTSTFRCPCITQYFDVNGECTGCLYHCQTCNNPSTCSTCNSTALRKLSAASLCICADNYFDDGTNQLCLPCSYACLTCVTTAIQCITCDTSQRSFVLGWCACAQYYYDNNNTVACSKCHYTCDTCLVGITCATCSSTKHRLFDSINQYCICAGGFYDDGMNELCLACNYRCLTCTNSTKCLTCQSSWFRATPISLCPCTDGYYDDGSSPTCLACHYTCKTCTNGSQCLSCDLTTNKRVFDVSYLCKCIDKFYDDTLSDQLCKACVYSCKTCSTVTSNCTACNETAMRVLTGTQCLCQQRWFDNLAQMCLRCHYRCSTCTAANLCTSCDSSIQRIADSSNGLCKCNNLFWDDGSTEACTACQPTCYTCTDLTQCITCNITRNRMLNSTTDFFNVTSPFCVCLYRYYSPGPDQDCQPCHYSCQVCTGAARTNCALCTPTLQRILKTAVTQCQCLDGYYDNNVTQPCQSCNVACAVCHTGLPNSCTSCNDPYYLLLAFTTCYTTCPDYYFDYQLNFTCQLCSQWCKTCVNESYCSSCETGKLLHSQACVLTCPAGTYAHSSGTICLDCPKGCYNCSGNSLCYSCFSNYYFSQALGFCFSCNSVCLNCTGPGQTDCTACQSPLIVYQNTCTVLDCPSGTYVEPTLGCVSCGNKFSGATLCNYTQPSKCSSVYLFNGNACVHCNNMPGYKLLANTQCGQICGDGILIYLQCDDGNTLSGDGCSSVCTIEPGWNCSNSTAGLSVCDLIVPPSISLLKIVKQFGENKVTIVLVLSRPVRVAGSRFGVIITGLTANQYSFEVTQNTMNYSLISIVIYYQADLQGKQLQLTYSSARRLQLLEDTLQSHPSRMLGTISFSSSFDLSSYPPANYYPTSTLDKFNLFQKYIAFLSVALLILCLIIIPKRMHLHSLTLIYLPAQIYIAFTIIPADYTDWIQYTLQNVTHSAMFGGFSMGQCCQSANDNLGVTTELMKMSGIAIWIVLGSWILLGLLFVYNNYCLNIQTKFKMIRYFIFTLTLLTLFSIAYNSMNGLHRYILSTKTDVFNTVLAISLNIFYILAIAVIWIRTYQLKVQPVKSDGKIYSLDKIQENMIIPVPMMSEQHSHQRGIKEAVINKSDLDDLEEEMDTEFKQSQKQTQLSDIKQIKNQEHQPLLYDYFRLYRHFQKNQTDVTKSKYFLPILLIKLYLTAVLASLMYTTPMGYLITSAIIEFTFLVFMIETRPFESTFTNIRIILVSLVLIAINVILSIYIKMSMDNSYVMLYEELVVILVVGLVAAAVAFILIQHILAWKRELWKKVFEPCLKGSRLLGTRNVAQFQPDIESSDHMDRSSLKMTGSSFRTTKRIQDNQQMDAFYARMLKKQNLKNKYKRERMIR